MIIEFVESPYLGLRAIFPIDTNISHKFLLFYNNKNSPMLRIQCGVPQDSILSPLLFLIYINYLNNSPSILSSIMFADDTSILFSHKDINELIRTFNSEMVYISSWLKCGKLSFNISKTNVMQFETVHSSA